MNRISILIIGVIYNTHSETLRYLESLKSSITGDAMLLLVDNSDKPVADGFAGKIRSYPFARYIKTKGNLGYFGGANEGLSYYLNEHPAYPKWVLITNVDIVFTPGFFEGLNKLDERKDLGVVAPSIISKKWNRDYNPKILKRYSKRKLHFYLYLYSCFLFHNLFLIGAYMKMWMMGRQRGRKGFDEIKQEAGRKIYAPHGSCLVLSDKYFTSGGDLKLGNFLFGEEILIAETSVKSGLNIEYHPELLIYDYEHASTGFFVNPKINRYNREAIQEILDRYYRYPSSNSR